MSVEEKFRFKEQGIPESRVYNMKRFYHDMIFSSQHEMVSSQHEVVLSQHEDLSSQHQEVPPQRQELITTSKIYDSVKGLSLHQQSIKPMG